MTGSALFALGGALVLSSLARASAECSFPQRVVLTHGWEADPSASWHIDALTILDEDRSNKRPARCDQAREYEGDLIVSALTSSNALGTKGIESLEGEWREREVGEGIEETLERAWRRGGTCIPTFHPSCDPAQLATLFPSASSLPQGADAASYFFLAHRLHQAFDTLSLLEAADITPSEEVTYSLSEIKNALSVAHSNPFIHCDDTESLVSISYPLTLSPPTYQPSFAPLVDSPPVESTCPDDGGIWYHPSLASRVPINRGKRVVSQTWDPIYRPSPRPITLQSDPSTTVVDVKRAEPTKAQKLKIFAGGDRRREQTKEDRHNEGGWGKRTRDEL